MVIAQRREEFSEQPEDSRLYEMYLKTKEYIAEFFQLGIGVFNCSEAGFFPNSDLAMSGNVKFDVSWYDPYNYKAVSRLKDEIYSKIKNHIYHKCLENNRVICYKDPFSETVISDPKKKSIKIYIKTDVNNDMTHSDMLAKRAGNMLNGKKSCDRWLFYFWLDDIEVYLTNDAEYKKAWEKISGSCFVWDMSLLRKSKSGYTVEVKYNLSIEINMCNVFFVEF